MNIDDPGRSTLTVLVADDEELARRRIMELLRRFDGFTVVAQCATGPMTLAALREHEPDILFLDVQMPGLDGFDVLREIPAEHRPVVIFSTAYDEYALAAFEYHAVDYLLKPFADERFAESVRRAARAIRAHRSNELHQRLRALLESASGHAVDGASRTAPAPLERIAVRTGERLAVIDLAAVDWIESAGDYVRIHTGAESHLLRTTMAQLEQRLDPARFLRIHRSAIVQLDRVYQLQPDDHGEYHVLLRSGRRIRVGRSYRSTALARFGVQW